MAKLGIQTIIFGKRTGDDFPGVLRDIKEAGYDGAEIGNQEGTRTIEEVTALFKAADLSVSGYHTGYATFTDLNALPRIADHLIGVGAKFLMCSGTHGRDREGYLRSAEMFDRAGRILTAHGVYLCYHNHAWEFEDLGNGERGMDILLENTEMDAVKLCLDVYWVACGNDDPAAFIRKHKNRAVYFHLKDGAYDAPSQKPLSFTELGRGQVDLPSAMEAIREVNPDWIVTEQDNTEGDPKESARVSAEYARTELGI